MIRKHGLGSPIERFTRAMFAKIIAGVSRSLREESFGITQIAALYLLDQEQQMTVTALADALGLSVSACSRVVDQLVKRGFCGRVESAEDRRVKEITLTQAGKALVDETSEARLQVILEAASSMPDEMVSAVMDMAEQYVGRRPRR